MSNLRACGGIFQVAFVLAGMAAATLFAPGAEAATGLRGSPHDFSSSGPAPNDLGASGACAACHRPHAAAGLGMWTRSLDEEGAFLIQDDDPDYVPGSTLLCYDCHDDNPARSSALIDDSPPRKLWRSGHEPQNVAFADEVPSSYERAPTRPGYYELIDGVVPSTGNRGPTDGSPTGGHYWKVTRPGKPEYRRGDKIACAFCHDPHRTRTGSNEAFLLTAAGDDGEVRIGDGLRASRAPRTRNGTGDGRRMCAACHAYSQSGSPGVFRSVALPRPPPAVAEHREGDRTPCTDCHDHNRIAPEGGTAAACDSCHGFPPTTSGDGWSRPGDTDESYPGGAGAHLAHLKGAGKPPGAPSVYDFGCLGGACHPEGTHREGGKTVSRKNVQVAFAPAWNPNGVFDAGSSPGADACTQLYCHSNGLVENGANPGDDGTGEEGPSGRGEWAESAGNPTFYGTTPASPATWGGSLGCKGCHGKGDPDYLVEVDAKRSARPVSAPDYLNAGTHDGLSDNQQGVFNAAGANTHYIHVYKLPNHTGGTCSCHGSEADAAPPKHVNRQADVSACATLCHNTSTYAWGAKLGTNVGDSCVFWCHGKMHTYDSAGGRVTKSPASTLPLDADPKYMRSGHGLRYSLEYPSGNPGAGLACSDCHLATDRFPVNGPLEASYHYERHPLSTGNPEGDLATNPYWLKNPYAEDPDGLCTSCHDGSNARAATGHTAQGMIEFGGYAPKYGTPWSSFTPHCVDCHDPHGEANWYMLYDADPERSASGKTPTYSGPVIYKGSRYGVTVAQSDKHGRPPGPAYERSQTPVEMKGASSGADFARGTGDGICEVCHTRTKYFQRNGSSPGGEHSSKDCTRCHVHQSSHAPMSCEGCHGKNGWVSAGANGRPGDADDAPNVLTVEEGFSWLSVWDGSWWDETQGGSDSVQQGGHGDPDGVERGDAADVPTCETCHDTELPPGTHFDGVYNSLGSELPMDSNRLTPRPKDKQNANTAHLRQEYFTKYPANGAGSWSTQVAVDNYCYQECHAPNRLKDHRHERDSRPADPNYRSVELGTHLTKSSTPDAITESDLNIGDHGAPDYSPCVACHNPHGSTCTDTRRGVKNRMIVEDWDQPATLCGRCHE